MAITKEMTIQDVLEKDENLAKVLMESGMHCIGCPMARCESLTDACASHGIDVDTLVENLNTFAGE